MNRRAALLGRSLIAFAAAALHAPADAQTVPTYGRGASPAEARAQAARLAELKAELALMARKYGVQERTLGAIARAIGQSAPQLDPAALLLRVREQVADVVRLNAEVADLRAQIGLMADTTLRDPGLAALERAQAAIDDGRLEDADRELAALEYLRSSELEASQVAWTRAVQARANVAKLQQDYDRATALLLAANREELARRTASEARSLELVWDAAGSQQEKGERFGSNEALLRAIDLYQSEVLPLAPRAGAPLKWAAIQHDLGNALQSLGARESDAKHLHLAVRAYHRALEERAGTPLDWAFTQQGLGNTLQLIGGRERGTESLIASLKAYDEALRIFVREKDTASWIMTAVNKANTLQVIGRREAGTARFEEASRVYGSALAALDRNRQPETWARTQVGLGNVLNALGERRLRSPGGSQGADELFRRSAASYRSALDVMTAQRSPFERAGIQLNLGQVLTLLGQSEGRTDVLREALRTYDDVLAVFTLQSAPFNWSMAQLNRGNIFVTLGQEANDPGIVAQALEPYQQALTGLSRQKTPVEWAMATLNAGAARTLLAEYRNDRSQLSDIEHDVRAGLEIAAEAHHAPLVAWGNQTLERIALLRRR